MDLLSSLKLRRYGHHPEVLENGGEQRGQTEHGDDQHAHGREQELDDIGVGHGRGSRALHQDRQQAGLPREPEECSHALEDELEPGQGNEEPAEIAKDSARERDQRLRERSSGHQ